MANLPTADEVRLGLRTAVAFDAKAPTDAFFVGPHNILNYRGLLLNNRRALDCYWVEEFTGFDDADLRVAAEENPQEEGETASPGFYGGRTMTMTGFIRAGNYPKVMAMGRALLDSFIDLVESSLTISTIDDPASFFTAPDMEIWARKADKAQVSPHIDQSDVRGILKRNFTIALRAQDPRFTSVETHSAVVVPQVITQLGRVYDRGYDLAYTTLMDPTGTPSTAANVITVRNIGNWFARPVYRFTGPMGGISLTNNQNSQMMRLLADIPAGEWIEVDTRRGVIYDQYGNPAGSVFDTSSDWVRLEPRRLVPNGDNTLSLGVSWFGAGAQMSVMWNDTAI